MRFRRGAREIEAIRFDGSERAAREISLMKGASLAIHAGHVEVVTAFERKFCKTGQWITRDTATGVMRVFDHCDFLVEHEAI